MKNSSTVETRRVRYVELPDKNGGIRVNYMLDPDCLGAQVVKFIVQEDDLYTASDPRPQWLQTAVMVANAGQHGDSHTSILGTYWTVWFEIDGDMNVVKFF